VRPVAVFNDAGLMLQAAEQDLGITLTREILAADALIDGRLVRLSPIAITHREAQPYNVVYPPGLEAWPPLVSFRRWLHDEVRESLAALKRAATAPALTTPARRSSARSTTGPKRPAGWRAPSSRRA
jgi:LysR family glycine cleavage system transcriptional activator